MKVIASKPVSFIILISSHVKPALWISSVLLFWMAGLASLPIALANDHVRGTSGCVDRTWTAVTATPSGRLYHTAVWTGTELSPKETFT